MTTNNTLYGEPTNWVGDGSGDGTIHVDGTVITVASATQGSPFNVLDDVNLDDDDNNVAYYFEGTITELDGSFSFGVIAKDEVAPGYKARGVFYNGNLTNGSAALRTGFGKYIQVGDTVGVLYDATATTTSSSSNQVYFYVNGQCLGLAFDIPSSNKQYLPCLHVTGTAKINIAVPETLPTKRDRDASPSGNDPYQGEWKLNKAFYGPELGKFPLPDNHNIIASFEEVQDAASSTVVYRFGIKVGNSMGTDITLTGKKFEGGFDEVTIGPIRSTMMMPPPELQPVEFELIGKGLPVVNKMIVTTNEDDGQKNLLLMQGPTIELELVPYVATFEPLTSYQ
jgi:hypothetical protein